MSVSLFYNIDYMNLVLVAETYKLQKNNVNEVVGSWRVRWKVRLDSVL